MPALSATFLSNFRWLAGMGRTVAASLKARLVYASGSTGRIAAIAEIMQEIGYDAVAKAENGEQLIEAHNCVFHKLAAKRFAALTSRCFPPPAC